MMAQGDDAPDEDDDGFLTVEFLGWAGTRTPKDEPSIPAYMRPYYRTPAELLITRRSQAVAESDVLPD